jgi:glycerol-3-phosphate cytidylyltransferase
MKTLYTGGTFDIFHFGHTNFLKKCSMISDKVVVALNTDDFIKQFKGRAPVMTYREREISLLNCPYVDCVVPNFSGADSKPTILSVSPDIVAIGDDWAHKDYFSQMQFTQNWLDENKIVLIYIPYTKGISTSEIISRVVQRDEV